MIKPETKKRKVSGRVKGTLSDPIRSSLVSKEKARTFGHLNLQNLGIKAEIGTTKCRTHTNPFASKYSIPVTPPDWNLCYKDSSLPLFVDIGCGAGRFSLAAASSEKWRNFNHLGIEIREKLVTRANAWKTKINLKNCFFVFANVNVSLDDLLRSYPGKVEFVCIQFPDPHFKKKHQKRRVLTVELLEVIAKYLEPITGTLFLQSDIESISSEMRDRTSLSTYFKREGQYTERDKLLDIEDNANGISMAMWTIDGRRITDNCPGSDYGDWLVGENPTGIVTERECQNKALNHPIYRSIFKRSKENYIESAAYSSFRLQERVKSLKMFANEFENKISKESSNINFTKLFSELNVLQEYPLLKSTDNQKNIIRLLNEYKEKVQSFITAEEGQLSDLIENNVKATIALLQEIVKDPIKSPLK